MNWKSLHNKSNSYFKLINPIWSSSQYSGSTWTWKPPYTKQLLRFTLIFYTELSINPAKVNFLLFKLTANFTVWLVILDYNLSVENLLVLTQAVALKT